MPGSEYESWPDHALAPARIIYELCIDTGQRIGDCVAMKRLDFDGEYRRAVQQKTRTGTEVYRPSELRAYFSKLIKSGAHSLAKNLTQSIGKRQVQKAVEVVRDGIGAKTKRESAKTPRGTRIWMRKFTTLSFEINVVRVKGLEPPRQRRQNLNLAII